MEKVTVIGAPNFARKGKIYLASPVGQEPTYVKYWNKIPKDPKARAVRMHEEYCDILECLHETGIPFTIAVPFRVSESNDRPLPPALKGGTPSCRLFTNDTSMFAYPRDYAVCLGDTHGLINTRVEMDFPIPEGITRSFFGEGGRSHLADRFLLTFRWNLDESSEGVYVRVEPPVETLPSCGVEITHLPVSLTRYLIDGKAGIGSELHVDRVSGLLEDRKGALHFFVHRQYYACDGTIDVAVFKPQQSIEMIQAMCDEFGITLHIMDELHIPGSLGFVQLATGQVIMTKGEPVLERRIRDLLGNDAVFITETPIWATPLIVKAGIRCVVTELPRCLTTPI